MSLSTSSSSSIDIDHLVEKFKQNFKILKKREEKKGSYKLVTHINHLIGDEEHDNLSKMKLMFGKNFSSSKLFEEEIGKWLIKHGYNYEIKRKYEKNNWQSYPTNEWIITVKW